MSLDATTIGIIGAAVVSVGLTAAGFLKTDPREMSVVKLEYDPARNAVTQHIGVRGGPIIAEWRASAYRDAGQVRQILCSGGGQGQYRGVEVEFPLNNWTGDECPAVQPGDVLAATWQYQLSDGTVVTISAEEVVE